MKALQWTPLVEKQNSQSTSCGKLTFLILSSSIRRALIIFTPSLRRRKPPLKRYLKQATLWLRVDIFIWLLREHCLKIFMHLQPSTAVFCVLRKESP